MATKTVIVYITKQLNGINERKKELHEYTDDLKIKLRRWESKIKDNLVHFEAIKDFHMCGSNMPLNLF